MQFVPIHPCLGAPRRAQHRPSAESERKDLHARIEEFDLELWVDQSELFFAASVGEYRPENLGDPIHEHAEELKSPAGWLFNPAIDRRLARSPAWGERAQGRRGGGHPS